MFSTDWPIIIMALCAFATGFAVFFSIRATQFAKSCVEWIDQNNKRAVTLKKIAEIETELTEVRDAIDAYGTQLKKLRSREGMRKLRESRKTADDEPDPQQDPDAWKRHMRQKLHLKKIGGNSG